MTKIDIKIAELKEKLAKNAKIHEANSIAGQKAYGKMKKNVIELLEDAGFKNIGTVDIDTWNHENRNVTICFAIGENTLAVTINKAGLQRFNVSGISGTPNRNDKAINPSQINEITDYYKTAGEILAKFGKNYTKNTSLLWDEVNNFNYPKGKKVPYDEQETKTELNKLIEEQKVASLELHIGKEIEYFEPKCRCGYKLSGAWLEGKVTRMTQKMIFVESESYGYHRQIRRENISNEIRPVKIA